MPHGTLSASDVENIVRLAPVFCGATDDDIHSRQHRE